MLDELGERLARARNQQGYSQRELAKLAGVGVATLRRIETGSGGQLESWLKLLIALKMTAQIDGFLPERLGSPLLEVGVSKPHLRRTDRSRPMWGDEKE